MLNHVKKDWQQNPTKKFPLNIIIPITSHSAFVNTIKQFLFHQKQSSRVNNNQTKNYPRKTFWLQKPSIPLQFRVVDEDTRRAVDFFYTQLIKFDSILSTRKQKHLLLIQPHLIFRDTLLMNDTEKALLHFYQYKQNDAATNSFLSQLKASYPAFIDSTHSAVRLFNQTDTLHKQVFVDYCHFTNEANRFIAKEIMQYIQEQIQ